MKLFKVVHKRLKSTSTFSTKSAAKLHRDELNGGLSTEPDKTWNSDKGWRVAVAEDHWRYA